MAVIHTAVLWKRPVDDSATGTRHVELKGFGKVNSPASPYLVANELIGTRIGERLGLPIPSGGIVPGEADGDDPAWVSLSFSDEGPPPISPARIVEKFPELAAVVTVFDLLIANIDRHRGNLSHIDGALQVFDHSHAVFGPTPGASAFLTRLRNEFALDGPLLNGVQFHRHCLLNHLDSRSRLMQAVSEVKYAVGDPFLSRIRDEVVTLDIGVTAEEAALMHSFLTHRRDRLDQLVVTNREEFAAIDSDEWGLEGHAQ